MDAKKIEEWWKKDSVNYYQDAFIRDFLGDHLFEVEDRTNYQFSLTDKGDSVWIIPTRDENIPYEVRMSGEKDKLSITLGLTSFHNCKPIPLEWLEDRKLERVKKELKKGGGDFAEILNEILTDVLLASLSENNKFNITNDKVDEKLAEFVDKLAQQGFFPDKCVFSNTLKGRLLQQKIIIPDKLINNPFYIGKTITGQDAFFSTNLRSDLIIVFDSSATLLLKEKMRFKRQDKFAPSNLGVCGHVNLNPIIKETRAIFAMEGIEESLTRPTKISINAPYVDFVRIEELIAIKSSDFDLTKLIKFCDELNLCFINECYLAIPMIIRAILDHVPPIFNFSTFSEVANNYGGKSFKDSMQHLERSSRKIADSILHSHIRRKETLPNPTQVNFYNALDVLLAEIVSKLS